MQNITLTDTSEIYYTGPLKIGTEVSTRQFLMDTGSDILWLTSTLCASCPGTSKYNPASGATIFSPVAPYSATYLDGTNVSGNWYKGNVGVSSAVVSNMNFVLASSSSIISSAPYVGICGLSV